jgi:serine/threonine protein phosphatase PrpC
MSRSFGDLEAEKIGVISEPKIVEFNCERIDVKFIVVATDGIWEFLSNEKVMNIILPYYNCDDVKGANRKLVEIAKKFWEVNNKMGVDDITSIIIFYK